MGPAKSLGIWAWDSWVVTPTRPGLTDPGQLPGQSSLGGGRAAGRGCQGSCGLLRWPQQLSPVGWERSSGHKASVQLSAWCPGLGHFARWWTGLVVLPQKCLPRSPQKGLAQKASVPCSFLSPWLPWGAAPDTQKILRSSLVTCPGLLSLSAVTPPRVTCLPSPAFMFEQRVTDYAEVTVAVGSVGRSGHALRAPAP